MSLDQAIAGLAVAAAFVVLGGIAAVGGGW